MRCVKQKKKVFIIVLSIIGIFLVALSCTPVSGQTPEPTITPMPSVSPAATPSPSGAAIDPNWAAPELSTASLPADLSDIVSQVQPAVVAINVTITSSNIFNQPISQEGAGSGWIIDSDGIIVTNAHVVSGADTINVTLDDGRIFPSERVASDDISDLAVIKIGATGLPEVKVGDSTKLKVGMRVMAMGNAIGEGIALTAGYVSRLGVSITIASTNQTLYNLIETDAAINPGNSGGPLIDSIGEVIGITNAKLVAEGVQSIGYAISTSQALPLIEQLVQQGYVTRPYIGVTLQTVNPAIAFINGLAVNQGALITQIAPNSPASDAGLLEGDVIVKIGDQDIITADEASQAILNATIGEQLQITYYRGNAQDTVEVTPVESPPPT